MPIIEKKSWTGLRVESSYYMGARPIWGALFPYIVGVLPMGRPPTNYAKILTFENRRAGHQVLCLIFWTLFPITPLPN